MNLPEYALLCRNNRCGLIDEEHYGIILRYQNGLTDVIGRDNDYLFSLRSCMKPLQLSAISEVIEAFRLTDKEIAVAAASHCGEDCHTEAVLSILNKAGLKEKNLLCPPHEPLSTIAKNKLIKLKKKPTAIYNNCSGKHAAILAYCVLKGYDINNYNQIEHSVQKKIMNYVSNICEIKLNHCKIAQDGCTLPVLAMPIKNLAKGFLNLFVYENSKIKKAILKNPYYFGGKGRLDSEIVKAGNGNLVAKVGAGNICCVTDVKTKEVFIIKIADSDNCTRGIVLLEILKRNNKISEQEYIRLSKIFSTDITDETGKIIGKTEFCF